MAMDLMAMLTSVAPNATIKMTVDQQRNGAKGQGKGRRTQKDSYWEDDQEAYYYNQFDNDRRNRGQGKGKGEGKGKGKGRSERKEEGEDGENPFEERRSRNVTCFNCGEKGHGVKECPFPLSCDMCGQKGHTENKCWMRGPCLNCGGDHHLNMCEEKRWTCSHCGRTGHISNRCFDLVGGRREVMQRKEEEKNRSQMLSSRQVQYAIRQYGWVAVEATGQVPEKTDTLIGAHGHTLFTLPLEVSSDFPNVHVCDMRGVWPVCIFVEIKFEHSTIVPFIQPYSIVVLEMGGINLFKVP